MADRVGASQSAMLDAASNFNTRYNEFLTASGSITSDTQALQDSWKGQGNDAFTGAMGSWNTDINNVSDDLARMSKAVQASIDAIMQTDANIAKAFAGFIS